MEQLLERIRPLGLRIRDVDGDGNCLFRAASMELFGAEGRHLEIRENVVAFMMANPEDFAPFVEDDMSFAEVLCCENSLPCNHPRRSSSLLSRLCLSSAVCSLQVLNTATCVIAVRPLTRTIAVLCVNDAGA